MWKILRKLWWIYSETYLEAGIYIGVRVQYWVGRVKLWHAENVKALCELIPRTCRMGL